MDEIMDPRQRQERDEAIEAADVALEHLHRADELLQSAGNWGMADLFLGGGIISFIKRGKMQDAEAELNAARTALERFVQEVHDVEGAGGVHIDTGSFMAFADILFDNPFIDMYVQGQISDARMQVEAAINQVEAMRAQLLGQGM